MSIVLYVMNKIFLTNPILLDMLVALLFLKYK